LDAVSLFPALDQRPKIRQPMQVDKQTSREIRGELMTRLNIRRLGYALGAEVTGVDLRQPLGVEIVAAIRQAWLKHIVLCFPGQELTPEHLMAFSERFGDLDDNRFSQALSHPDHAPVFLISNSPVNIKEKRIDGAVNDHWHSDLSFSLRPSTATILNAQQLPEIGGDTMFANMYMAYDALSPAFKEAIESLEAVHDVAVPKAFSTLSPATQASIRQKNPPVAHQLVRVHPETGAKALNVGRISGIVGMNGDESKPLIDFMNRHATRYEFIYRHRWSVNDLLMWDNRCALHYAIPDYEPTCVRLLQRCSLLGERSGYIPSSSSN